jgi:hypothetical protein
MYVANAWKRTQRSRPKDDSPLTAGVAKTSGGFKTAQELKLLGERSGWVAGPISPEDVKAMGADRLRWEELFNKEELERALSLPAKIKHDDTAVEQWKAKAFWDNAANTPPEMTLRAVHYSPTIASASTSTSISGEIKLLTCTMLVAGRIDPKNSPCARPTFSHSPIFVT